MFGYFEMDILKTDHIEFDILFMYVILNVCKFTHEAGLISSIGKSIL